MEAPSILLESSFHGERYKAPREEKLRLILKSAPSWAFGALILMALAAAAAAQTEPETEPPPSNAPGASPAEQVPPIEQAPSAKPASPTAQMERFLGTAIPGTNYIASASRMATALAGNDKLRKIAVDLAKQQTSLTNSLARWVNVNGPVVTRQNPYAVGGGGITKVEAPQLLPAQASNLRQLSQLRGASFDSLYVSSLKETLGQLKTLFREFGEGAGDADLRAIAKRELPQLEQAISALNAL